LGVWFVLLCRAVFLAGWLCGLVVLMRYAVRLPNGKTRPFLCPLVFGAYVAVWPDDEFSKVWISPFYCFIQSIKAPF
jgi:hypothetical protein